MSKKRKLTKREKNMKYVWEQVENWLEFRFKIPMQVEVTEKQGLVREHHRYSLVRLEGKMFTIYIDSNYLLNAKRQELLELSAREAILIYLMLKNKRPVNETDDEYRQMLVQYGLPYYGTMPQEGAPLWEYTCLGCKEVVMLTTRKIPESKGIAYNPKKLTECCNKMIKEEGRVHYTNEELQKARLMIENSVYK